MKDIAILSRFIGEHIDLETVKMIAQDFIAPDVHPDEEHNKYDVKVGIASDSAFCFYYQDAFDSLKMSGAELIFFSPMSDELPCVDGIYLGGGYPELYARELEASAARRQVKKASEDGMPIYGECGALLYLNDSLRTDRSYKMVGALGAVSRMTDKLAALGYTEAVTVSNSPFARSNRVIRGHEFHYSVTECDRDAHFVYELKRGKGIQNGRDGLMEHNTMASYMLVARWGLLRCQLVLQLKSKRCLKLLNSAWLSVISC